MIKPHACSSPARLRNFSSGVFILFLISSLIFSGLLSINFVGVSAQTDNRSLQSSTDDRANQTLDNAKKLRQVPGEKVPNQYIVVLKDSTAPSASVRASADEARNQGALVRHVYEHVLRGFAITIPNDRVLNAILNNPRVGYVQPDLKYKAFIQTLPTGIDRTDADLSTAKSGDGTGSVDADIAILDTGIDLTHPDLNVVNHVECITTSQCITGLAAGNDDDGHGTHVAGIAAAKDNTEGVVGMAPGARLWAVKVLDSNGNGFDSDIIAGIDYITDTNDIDVVNMSFGGDCVTECDTALHTAIINSVAAGITYTAAAGNEGKNAQSVEPANYPEVITVSAISDTNGNCGPPGGSSDDRFASFSNYGSVVDIAAPGVSIRSTYTGNSYATMSGTSMATPHVTGAAALYKSLHSGATPADVKNALLSSGSTLSTICDGKGHGYFTSDKDSIAEPLLYVASSSVDTTPPTVTSTNPASGANGFPVASSITATFSEAIQPPTVTTSTFTLKNSAGTTIAGLVGLTNGNLATFDPQSSLLASTTYTATLTTGIKDIAGNALNPAKSWSFTTAAESTSSCGNNLPLVTATSSGTQNSFPPTNAIDNNFNTRWYSTFIVNPWIQVDLGAQKSVCSVDIAWTDGASRQYSFQISVSTDGSSYTNVFSGKSSGTTASPQKYSFAETQARFVKITITQSHTGSANSLAQISEIDIFGKAGASSSSKELSSSTQSHSKDGKSSSNTLSSSLADHGPSLNKPPVARDDRIQTEVNIPVEIGILANDNDPDGDKLKIKSVASPSQNVGVVTINENDTVTFFPGLDYAGTVRFSYTISDGVGNTDKAKVTVIIKPPTDRTLDQSIQGQDQDVQGNQHESEVKKQHQNQVDNKAYSELSPQEFHRGGETNDTDNDIP
jgi:subtilisin